MDERQRLPVERSYAELMGYAVYNFTYLEWAIIWLVERMQPGFLATVRSLTAGAIAKVGPSPASNMPR